ncbi:hypothetical protein JCM9279_000603 [Rhodotorula babjevae]
MRRAAAGALRSALSSRGTPTHPRPAPRRAALVHPRPFSSTAPTSFFFRKPTKSADDIARELVQARRDDRPDLVAKLYPSFVEAVADSSSSSSSSSRSPPLARGQFQDLMRFAAKTGKFRLALRMFNDAPARLGFHHSLEDHQILLMALARVGRVDKAIAWVESMRDTHGLAPSVSEWNVVVQGYRRLGDLDGMRTAIERMRARGVEPNVVTYNTLLAALFEHGDLAGVRRAVEDMCDRRVEHDMWTEQTLLAGFLRAGELASARDVQRRLRGLVIGSVAPDASGKGKSAVDQGALNGLVQFEAVENGFEAGVQLAGEMSSRGLPLNARTLSTLVQYGASELGSADEGVALLDRLEDALGIEADRHAWSTVIAALARRPAGAGALDEALRAYQVARDRSVQPDSSMVQPLLSALLLPSPTPDALASARELYDDLATSSRSFTTAPDASIYITLLRACADPIHPDLEWSRSLIGDMKQRSIRLDGPSTTWHIVALMRAAASFDEAFAAYDEMRALDPTVLERTDYNTILSAFTTLTFPSSSSSSSATESAAPAPLIMEFMTDMRTSGHPPDSTTYALLLTYYSRAASASPATIAHLHSLIKLDVHLDPDTPLFNALMGAYSRTGAYNAAYRIWDAMLLYRSGDPTEAGISAVSVSTLLDTAAHDGSPAAQRRVERVWDDLARGTLAGGRVRRTANNWDAWVEALGRWGRIAEAEEVVFRDMAPLDRRRARDGNAAVGDEAPVASEGTVRALLKFAARDSEEAQQRVAQRVRDERPDLWPLVEKLALRKRWTVEGQREGGAAEQSEEDGPDERAGFFSSSATTKAGSSN